MRKSLQRGIAIVSVLAVALIVALPVRAEEKAPKKAHQTNDHQFTGAITAVDATAGTLTVKNKRDESKDFTSEKALLADLKVGDKVMVKYVEKDGKNTAQKVAVAGAGKEKKEKKEKAEKK